jgi:hypothetical protein
MGLNLYLERRIDMENEKLIKEYNDIASRLLNGEYDDFEQEKKRYLEVKKLLDEAGITLLDGVKLDTLLF